MISVLMNRVESAVITSPPRRWLQRWYEVPWLRRLGGDLPPGARILDLGCGPGYGSEMILDRFGADRVDGVDLDPRMVERARRRLRGYGDRVHLSVGDAGDLRGSLDIPDASYDAVFDFAVVHHVPQWRLAVAEVARVLRPGGMFYFDEVTAHALARPTYRLLFDHPREDRFSGEQFVAACEAAGLSVGGRFITRVQGDYLLGAARRN